MVPSWIGSEKDRGGCGRGAYKCKDDGPVIPPNAFDDAGTDNDSQSNKYTGQGQHDNGHDV